MGMVIKETEQGYKYDEETHYTFMKTSLFFSGDGFSVYDSEAHLLFRVDSYGGPGTRSQSQLFLMAPDGRCLLTLRRKWASFHQRWEGYAGEFKEGSKPAFSVLKSSMMERSSYASVTVEMHDSSGCDEYLIEGSFAKRSCKVYDAATRAVVAEIRRKMETSGSANVVLGKDVFHLFVRAGFDCAFATALVLVLDQICGADEVGEVADAVAAASESAICENLMRIDD